MAKSNLKWSIRLREWYTQGGDRVCRRKDPPAVSAEHSLSRREGRLPPSEEGEELAAELERTLAVGAVWQKVERCSWDHWKQTVVWPELQGREAGLENIEAGDAGPQVAASTPWRACWPRLTALGCGLCLRGLVGFYKSSVLLQHRVITRALWTQHASLLLDVSMVTASLRLPCWLCHFPGRSCFTSEHVRFLIPEKEIRWHTSESCCEDSVKKRISHACY